MNWIGVVVPVCNDEDGWERRAYGVLSLLESATATVVAPEDVTSGGDSMARSNRLFFVNGCGAVVFVIAVDMNDLSK